MFSHNMKPKHDYYLPYVPISSFQHLVNPMWPQKHVPKRKLQPPMMKQGPSPVYHEYQHSNNNLSSYQSLQVLNYPLVTFEQTKWNLSIGIPAQPKDPLNKWVIGPLVLAYYTSMLSLQLHIMLNRVTIYCPILWTRE